MIQVGGITNTKIQSIAFHKFPIHKAQFSADGEEIVASSNNCGNIQVHNLISGKSTIIPHNKQMEKGSYKVEINIETSTITPKFIRCLSS